MANGAEQYDTAESKWSITMGRQQIRTMNQQIHPDFKFRKPTQLVRENQKIEQSKPNTDLMLMLAFKQTVSDEN